MGEKKFLAPAEIAAFCAEAGYKKVSIPKTNAFVLSIIAGAFIGFAAFGANMASHNLLADPGTYGLGRCVSGLIFSVGLMMVVVGGAELFTGNTMIFSGVLEKRVTIKQLLINWILVWVGNLAGSVLIAFLVTQTPLLNSSANILGAVTIKVAASKAALHFIPAVFLGILCNWLVCMGVWMSWSAQDVTGKLFACFFPIWLFVCSGFEHSVANMTYIPMGIFAKANPDWVNAALQIGVTAEQIKALNWGSMFTGNLIPVTIGNIIGGAFFVSTLYWYGYRKQKQQ